MAALHHISSGPVELAVEVLGDGPPLIFAHGLTGYRRSARLQLGPLADRYTIIAFDQRGHGDSTPIVDPMLYDAAAMAADIGVILDKLGVERAIVGGESMGAATALLFALSQPQRVSALLLTAPAFGDQRNAESEGVHTMGDAIARMGLPHFLAAAALRQRDELGWPPQAIEAVAAMQGGHQTASLATACRTVADWVILPDLSVVAALPMPVCVIAWPDDPLHPIVLAQRLVGFLAHGRLAHFPPLPEIFVHGEAIGQIYSEFLRSL